MPVCPRCGNEYDAEVTHCIDCEVELVDGAAGGSAGTAAPIAGALLAGVDGEVAAHMLTVLQGAAIPCMPLAQATETGIVTGGLEGLDAWADRALLIPGAFLGNAVQRLERDPRLVAVADGEEPPRPAGLIPFRFFDAERDEEIRDDPLLSTPAQAAGELDEAALDRLCECLLRGTPIVVERAMGLLGAAGTAGAERLRKALEKTIARGEQVFAGQLCRWLLQACESAAPDGGEAEDGPPRLSGVRAALLPVVRDALGSESPAVRCTGALVAGGLELLELAPQLIDLLRDPDAAVAGEADETLIILSDEDLVFEPEMSEEDKDGVIEARREWWREAQMRGLGAPE